ncbi:hypothetical protein Tsubulata_037980 [Turnera subulata]|uniref:DUF761 domain-containing protein n=1 Tax=Turnera subulata TaxID=218843 RepID=A0A9Q0G4N0_9ROSI|nr:hypothetical protein Tsubulata_037980 [Turnera subulata]
MKNKASGFLKRIMSILTSVAKARALALKSKTSALRTRLIIFSLLRNKKLVMNSISNKLQALMAQGQHEKRPADQQDMAGDDVDDDHQSSSRDRRSIMLYNQNSAYLPNSSTQFLQEDQEEGQDSIGYGYGYEDDQDKYPDLTHSLFDSEDLDFEDPGGSVIDIVKNAKQEGEEFRLEDEIDHVADLFIKRFHRQMRLQKQLSIKRHQEILAARGVASTTN